jgi:hypothetical protein
MVMSEALDLMHALVVESGQRWGEIAHDFQREDAEVVLLSSTPNHFLTRPRGDSKTTDLAGMNLTIGLVQAPARARMYALAADEKQGRLLVDAMAGLVARTPELANAVTVRESSAIFHRSQARLEVLAADQASIWGLRPYLVTVDELGQWHQTVAPQRCWEAVSSAVVKVGDARLVVLTTASDPGHWSRAVLDHALADELWRVHEVPGPPHWVDPKRLEGERRRLPESSYRRLFLNEWASSEDRLADEEDLVACVSPDEWPRDPVPGVTYCIGVDIGLKNDATVAAVCHAERMDGSEHPRVVLDRLGVWEGSRLRPVRLSVVEEWLAEVARRYNHARLRLDPYQAVQLAQGLRRSGVTVDEVTFSATSIGRMAAILFQAIRERSISIPDDPDLLHELRNVQLRESSPGVWRLDHSRSGHDDRAVAIALAASWLVERPAREPMRLSTGWKKLAQEDRRRELVARHLTFRSPGGGIQPPRSAVPGWDQGFRR